MPSGKASNAEFRGAKTVNGPEEDNVSTRPAAETAATNVEKRSSPAAISTIVFAYALAAAILRVTAAIVVLSLFTIFPFIVKYERYSQDMIR